MSPKLMIKELITGILMSLNSFPTNNGIMLNVSPRTIVDGRRKIEYSVKSKKFGSFAYIHLTSENTINSGSIPSVSLRRTNENGCCFFLNLETGKCMHIYNWREIPILESTIKAVQN